jgi:hypothetical protein
MPYLWIGGMVLGLEQQRLKGFLANVGVEQDEAEIKINRFSVGHIAPLQAIQLSRRSL